MMSLSLACETVRSQHTVERLNRGSHHYIAPYQWTRQALRRRPGGAHPLSVLLRTRRPCVHRKLHPPAAPAPDRRERCSPASLLVHPLPQVDGHPAQGRRNKKHTQRTKCITNKQLSVPACDLSTRVPRKAHSLGP